MAKKKKKNLAESIRQRFAALGGVELELPKRDPVRPPAASDWPEGSLAGSEARTLRKNPCASLPRK
jgi:hypothetical protein